MRVPGAELARDYAIEAINSGSRTMSSVSSSDSRSSGLMSTNDGRPFLVTRIRSCSTSTRCASSERCALASLKTTVCVIGQYSDLFYYFGQPLAYSFDPIPSASASARGTCCEAFPARSLRCGNGPQPVVSNDPDGVCEVVRQLLREGENEVAVKGFRYAAERIDPILGPAAYFEVGDDL